MFKSTRALIGAAAMAAMIPFATPAAAGDTCSIVADAAGNAANMRLAGASQTDTARAASVWFSEFINSPAATSSMSNAERRAFAANWSTVATKMIQLVYTIPKKDLRSDRHVAEVVYGMCARG